MSASKLTRKQSNEPTQEKHQAEQLSSKVLQAVETSVLRVSARNLATFLQLRLGDYSDQETDEGPDPVADADKEMESNDDFWESFDDEDSEADPDGDFSEEDEPPSLLEGVGLSQPDELHRITDVVVERLAEDSTSLVVRSGISHLLLGFSSKNLFTSAYRRGLEKRIVDTICIAQDIVDANRDFFLRKKSEIKQLRGDELCKKHGLSGPRLSRLKGSACILTPWQEEISFETCFKRSIPTETTKALLQVFAECAETERENPLSDSQLTRYLNLIVTKPLKRSTIQNARKTLGIPNAQERNSAYIQGKSLVEMITQSTGDEGLMNLELLLRKVEQRISNAQARRVAQAWLSEINERLKKS